MDAEQLAKLVADKPAGELIEQYIKARDAKKELERVAKLETAKYQEFMDAIEIELMKQLDKSGTDNLAVRGVGTAFRKLSTKCSVESWDDAFRFIQQNNMWHMLVHNVRKEAVEEYMRETSEPVPGVGWRVEEGVEIRRGK